MKIAICGSMSFAKEMLEVQKELEGKGNICYMPSFIKEIASGEIKINHGHEHAQLKIQHNLIKKYYDVIKNVDAIVVLNYKKNDIENYIGGNAFLEMGFAHILGKKIFLFNPVPNNPLMTAEIEAMQPIVLNGDLSKVG